ncbi:MAG: SprB repeat-containing protein [Chitinophagales bacterium]
MRLIKPLHSLLYRNNRFFKLSKHSLYKFLSVFLLLFSFHTSSIAQTCSGNATTVVSSHYTYNSTRALGVANNSGAGLYNINAQLVLDLGNILNSGQNFTIRWADVSSTDPIIRIEQSLDGVNFTTATGSPFTVNTSNSWANKVVTTNTQTRYLRITNTNDSDLLIDAITFTSVSCDNTPNFTNRVDDGTCTGSTVNNDAAIISYSIINANRIGISSANASSYNGNAYASASTISGGTFTFSNLMHNTTYIIRAFNGNNTNFTDATVSVISAPCQPPSDLPWTAGDCGILLGGVAAATCGVTTSVPESMRWSFGLMDIKNSIPASGRVDQSGNQAMYHHSSWHIDQIGNVYGIAMNQTTGDIFLTASANYGAGFLGQPGIIKYGSIGGGASSLAAAGTVYRIDGYSGQASVFAQLPQQSTTINNEDCETTESASRTTGPGLGNIAYDETHNQYFVSNIEDGRIYRLNASGTILDSYDPLIYDNGAAGITNLEDLAYGLAVEPDGGRLFFGMVDAPNGGSIAGVGTVPIYSVALTGSGGFSGTVNNTNMPSGATYNNYVGADVFHTNISTGSSTGSTYTTNTVYLISDLAFSPNGDLLAAVRVSCKNTFFSSYNHWGETNIITKNGSGIYNNSITELNVSVQGDAAVEDSYGGVGVYELQDGSGEIHYVLSSSDILDEAGPHGIAVFKSTTTNSPISPLGALSYGFVDSGDPKGMGGDVEVFSSCDCTEPTASASADDGTCSTGTTPNNDASITLSGISNGTRISISSANAASYDGDVFFDATNISGSSATLSNLQHNADYIIRVFNGGGACYTDFTITTPDISIPTCSASNDSPICIGNTLQLTSTGGMSWSWSSNGSAVLSSMTAQNPTATNVSNGEIFSVTVTDGNGCSSTCTTTATVTNPPILTPNNDALLCNGDSNGTVSVGVSGGSPTFNYAWSTGGNAASITNLSAGTYTVTVTDASNCVTTATATVTEPSTLGVVLNPSNVTVKHGYDGSITTSVTGGTPNYAYEWSNGETTANLSALSAGTYTVTVTDFNDCTQTAEVTITQPNCPPNIECGRVSVARN